MSVTNLVALQFAMGYQGGTIYQMAEALRVSTGDILNADDERMGELLRMAQEKHVLRKQVKSLMYALDVAKSYLLKAIDKGLLENCVLPLSVAYPKLEKIMDCEE